MEPVTGDVTIEFCFGTCDSTCPAPQESIDLAGTSWVLNPAAGALAVGPNQGSGAWWTSSDAVVQERACLFDDVYTFNSDGSYEMDLGSATWLEGWQGMNPEGCGAPVAPHDGSNQNATWVLMGNFGNGLGALLGLAMAVNGAELGAPSEAPEMITYEMISATESQLILDINAGGAWWRFTFAPAPAPPVMRSVTFRVDMGEVATTPIGVVIAGNFQGWGDGETAVAGWMATTFGNTQPCLRGGLWNTSSSTAPAGT